MRPTEGNFMTGDQHSHGIEWMLQNPDVDDETLAAALQDEYLAELNAFAFMLTNDQYQTPRLAAHAIARAIERRRRLYPESSLRAWMFGEIYRDCPELTSESSLERAFLKLRRAIGKPVKPCPERRADGLEGLSHQGYLSLALYYGHNFSSGEVGSVLGLSSEAAERELNLAHLAAYRNRYGAARAGGESLDQEQPVDEEPAERIDDGLTSDQAPVTEKQAELKLHLSKAFALPAFPESYWEVRAAIEQTKGKNHKRGQTLGIKELALVGIVLIGLWIFGRNQGVFEAFDARPTWTSHSAEQAGRKATDTPVLIMEPTLTALQTPAFPGVEGVDYFVFEYNPHYTDTFELLAGRTGMTPDDIRALNGILPSNDWVWKENPLKLVIYREQGSFAPDPAESGGNRAALLNGEMPVEKILERLASHEAIDQVFWADLVTYYYSNPAFLGATYAARMQFWIMGPDHWVIHYQYGEETGHTSFRTGNWIFNDISDPTLKGSPAGETKPGYRGYWDEEAAEGIGSLLFFLRQAHTMADEYGVAENSLRGSELMGGREAIVLDLYNPEGGLAMRAWVDMETGITLKTDHFSSEVDGEYPGFTTLVNALETNIEFPAGFFYPPTCPVSGLEGPPIDHQSLTLPQRLEGFDPPPEGFDIAPEPIYFQHPEHSLIFSFNGGRRGLETYPLDVYAGEYYLGRIENTAPFVTACRRSPDRTRAVISAGTNPYFNEDGVFFLLDLMPLKMIQLAGRAYRDFTFAFSPDGDSLAYSTCFSGCQIIFLNLTTEESVTHRIKGPVTALGWSPDGRQLAYITQGMGLGLVTIIEVDTYEELFTGKYYWQSQSFDPASPTEEWGVPFPADAPSDCHKFGGDQD
jgi:hypothetical protein